MGIVSQSAADVSITETKGIEGLKKLTLRC